MNPANGKERRVLVLEPDDQLASAIADALREANPEVAIDRTHTLEEAQKVVLDTRPDLFVLDLDAAADLAQEFLYDLRTSHPNARAIILTAVHLAAARERTAGLGAIHLLEKPFPHSDFVDLVQATLQPAQAPDAEKFQGTLSDLHIPDIIQLKCMSGATAAIELTGPAGEKGRVYFDKGQVCHATAAGQEGLDAFNQIMTWKGGRISEVPADLTKRTIGMDWQMLVMEATRKLDEERAAFRAREARKKAGLKRKILIIDDSLMLLSFVKDILTEANFDASAAATAAEGLEIAINTRPDLILLDYVLPDMRGDEITKKLREDPATADIPVVFMSAIGVDLKFAPETNPNVIGFLNKPFTSDLLIKTVEGFMPKSPDDAATDQELASEQATADQSQPDEPFSFSAQSLDAQPQTAPPGPEEWWSSPQTQQQPLPQSLWHDGPTGDIAVPASTFHPDAGVMAIPRHGADLPDDLTGGSYFCGDTRFFSLNWAIQTIAKCKLTGTLHSYWDKEPVDLFAHEGQVVLATTRDPELYCSEAPITLVNVDPEKIAEARAHQRETGQPLFITLAKGGHILEEPATQLVQHYGLKLFAQLWTSERVRFTFEQAPELPGYVREITPEADIDHWELATLRLIQFQDLGTKGSYDINSIPAYTRDGFERVQHLRLTVAEAQFASQFNGVRSIAQIAKNLRLDLKFARLTLFRFLALEIVECWPAATATKPERKSVLQRLGRTIGIGE
jgi:DNA-binding response OmpR family regulator